MSTLCLLNSYSKYSNRLAKRVEKYSELSSYTKVIVQNINFGPNDGVNTTQILNWSESWTPDYLMILESVPADDSSNVNILQRWFVINSERTRKNQYRFTLRRDLVSEDLPNMSDNICSITRCNLTSDNPLIFNHEPFEFNQIKKDEVALYDRTGCAWIVGYLPRSMSSGINGHFSISNNYDIDMSSTPKDEWQYTEYANGSRAVKGNAIVYKTKYTISYAQPWYIGGYYGGYAYQDRNGGNTFEDQAGSIGLNNETIRYSESNYNTVKNANRSSWANWTILDSKLLTTYPNEFVTNSTIRDIEYYNGKKILFQDGVYQVSFRPNITMTSERTGADNDVTNTFLSQMQTHVQGEIKHKDTVKLTIQYMYYDFYLTKVEGASILEYSIPTTSNKLSDAPYRMFCIPYPEATADAPKIAIGKYVTEEETTTFSEVSYCDKELTIKLVQDIIERTVTGTQSSNLYDIQILPYCPIEFESYGTYQGRIALEIPSGFSSGIDYTDAIFTDGTTETGKMTRIFFPKESSFKFTISNCYDNGIFVNMGTKFAITNTKIQNETEFSRICSPNYGSAYDFVPAKNNGLNSIEIMCTYKPYNPFVLLTPTYSGLYGDNFGDSRGLILEGDFSLPIVNSAWVQYELNNKTYQQSFNREIKHLEKEYDIQRQEAMWQLVAGTAQGTASGAVAGGMTGNPYAAVAGAVVGGVSSLAGGIADYENLNARQSEDLSYRKDIFNYSLQNIKALPNALTKTSSINANSKYVPFIELYSATDEEKQILADYIKYNGMTAGYVGPINMSGFVQANIIRYFGTLDEHELSELNKELMKGVYF